MFVSLSAGASPDELMRGLRAVIASAGDPRLIEILGEEAPIAVLAQEHLEFETWCTVERRAGDLYYEGWTAGGRERFTATSHPELDAVIHAAADAVGAEPALLEVGLADGKPWVLQVRTAPSRAPAREEIVAPSSTTLHAGLGAHIHPGDESHNWRTDLEHCPTPLSVLLATAFGRWIAADEANSPSRIVDGRWHDPVSRPTSDRDVHADWDRWRRQLAERIEPGIRALEVRHDALDGGLETWRAFLDAWLTLQRKYFAMPTGAARAWAREKLAESGGRPGLGATPSAERLRRWGMLRAQLLQVIPAPTPESIAHWIASHPSDLLAVTLAKTLRFDRRIAPLPYDGFTPGLDEDPWPFFRTLCSEIQLPDPEPTQDELASAILALAETDNDQLLESYAIWRSAVRRIADRRGLPSARDLHFVDIESFETWLAEGGAPPDAAPGRALHTAWTISNSPAGGALEGRPAAPGQARGPVRLARSLLEIEDSGIAVVDTLGPADAIAVPRFDAIVCATGDVLGHASVLCREFGIPCVVGVTGVRERLARTEEVFVDGDRGIVLDLSEGTPST
jgi:phosphohistidine swiveling domain-containing protein